MKMTKIFTCRSGVEGIIGCVRNFVTSSVSMIDLEVESILKSFSTTNLNSKVSDSM